MKSVIHKNVKSQLGLLTSTERFDPANIHSPTRPAYGSLVDTSVLLKTQSPFPSQHKTDRGANRHASKGRKHQKRHQQLHPAVSNLDQYPNRYNPLVAEKDLDIN